MNIPDLIDCLDIVGYLLVIPEIGERAGSWLHNRWVQLAIILFLGAVLLAFSLRNLKPLWVVDTNRDAYACCIFEWPLSASGSVNWRKDWWKFRIVGPGLMLTILPALAIYVVGLFKPLILGLLAFLVARGISIWHRHRHATGLH